MANTDLLQIQNKINTHKENLANNLINKEVSASKDETFTALIGKVNQITGGGGGGESSLDWSTVTDMMYMFYTSPSRLEFLAPSINCDMSQVEKWNYAFYGTINSSKWDIVFQDINFQFKTLSPYQFYNCNSLTDIKVSDDFSASDMKYVFYNCMKLPLAKAVEIINRNENMANYQNCCSACGQTLLGNGTEIIEGMTINASSMTSMFSSCSNLLKFGNITNNCSNICELDNLFNQCSYLEEVGLITLKETNRLYNIFSACTRLKKIVGFNIQNERNAIIIGSSTLYLLGNGHFYNLEECLQVPISYFAYGGKNIAFLYGTSSSRKPLKRLTFSTTDIPYLNKSYEKSFNIEYCSFDREGMVEMFNSLPDANDVTGAKIITITGNLCVDNGTLTDDDIAIATVKGYTIKTA